jgi:hypothetical protein
MAKKIDKIEAEFTAFCRKDGLSPSGTDAQRWREARPLGLLPAIWAVLNAEIPTGAKLEELLTLEPYAQSPLEPKYYTTSEAARELDISSAWLRSIMNSERIEYKDTPLGRLITQEAIDKYRKDPLKRAPGRPATKVKTEG